GTSPRGLLGCYRCERDARLTPPHRGARGKPRALCESGQPSAPRRRPAVLLVVRVIVFVVVNELVVVVIEVMIGLTSTRQFALQGGEVGVRGVVFQLPGHLRLLGLSTAAPHGSTPSHRIRGSPKAGPDDVRHLSWLLRYMDDAPFGTSGCVRHHPRLREGQRR